MSSNNELVETVYTILKEYIPAKDMQLAADHLVEELQELLDEQEVYQLSGLDKYVKNSVEELMGEEDFEEFEEDEY